MDQAETPSLVSQTNDKSTSDSVIATPVTTNEADSLEKAKEMEGGEETEEKPRPSSPPNPFDDSDQEEEEGAKEEDTHKCTANGDLPSLTHDSHHEGPSRPVPAPRRVSEPTPPPRPAPRVRLPRTSDGLTVGVCLLQKINAQKVKYVC